MNCGGHIEFPAAGEGRTVNCPHCGRPTKLSLQETTPKTPVRKGLGRGILTVIVCLLLAGGAAVYFFVVKPKVTTSPPAPPPKVVSMPTNPPAQPITNTETQPAVKRKKSPDDLKVSGVQLEKTKGSSLVYAVGTVKNDSDYQRFGVRIELDLFNQKGAKVGTSQDYIAILEPRHEWQFRALIPDPKTVTAKVATLKEEE